MNIVQQQQQQRECLHHSGNHLAAPLAAPPAAPLAAPLAAPPAAPQLPPQSAPLNAPLAVSTAAEGAWGDTVSVCVAVHSRERYAIHLAMRVQLLLSSAASERKEPACDIFVMRNCMDVSRVVNTACVI